MREEMGMKTAWIPPLIVAGAGTAMAATILLTGSLGVAPNFPGIAVVSGTASAPAVTIGAAAVMPKTTACTSMSVA